MDADLGKHPPLGSIVEGISLLPGSNADILRIDFDTGSLHIWPTQSDYLTIEWRPSRMNTHHIKPSKDGQFYVVERSENGEDLNTSETFHTKASAIANIKASVPEGAEVEIIDETAVTSDG